MHYLMEHVMIMHFIQHGAVAKIKQGDQFLNKRSGTQFYDWKSMWSIFDILYKNFHEDHIKIPGDFQDFQEGF